jgi:hypothetical protein
MPSRSVLGARCSLVGGRTLSATRPAPQPKSGLAIHGSALVAVRQAPVRSPTGRIHATSLRAFRDHRSPPLRGPTSKEARSKRADASSQAFSPRQLRTAAFDPLRTFTPRPDQDRRAIQGRDVGVTCPLTPSLASFIYHYCDHARGGLLAPARDQGQASHNIFFASQGNA